MTMNDESRASAPIVVDVALAIQQMTDNPELVTKMHELAFGPLAAQQLAVRDEIIDKLVEVLNSFPGFTDNATIGDSWLERRIAALALARGEA